jgi:acyl-CoA synthetase (AMP-forming)/AMP-acid ligase II/thioesterase domain-containing protein/acyl carrier protein
MIQKSEPHTIQDLIYNGNQNPDNPAIESPGYRPLTYRDLKNQVFQVIKTLNAMGFGQNDRIAVIMPAGPETAVLGIAIMAGFTHTPLNPQYKETEFQVILPRLKVKAVMVQKNHQTAARSAAISQNIPIIEITPSSDQAGSFRIDGIIIKEDKEVRFSQPEDTAIVMQTSGTTSLPKIVPLTQRQVCKSVRILCSEQSISAKDKSLHIVPHFHLLGVIGTVLVPLAAGGSVICTRDFIPSDFPSLLKTCRPTFYVAGPAHHQAILHELKKVPPVELENNSLRFIRSVSAPMPEPVRQELETLLGIPLFESYAMTESPNITINMARKEGSVGIPLIESLVILDENGNRSETFSTGEVAIRGDVVFSGYEDAADENAAAFTNGWFRTGDMGYLDDKGYLYLTGRKKELINKGGEKISPAEVDQVLMTHPSVRQAMAFRVNDPVLGEDISAMVVMENVTTCEEELRRYLLERLVPYKVPRRIHSVDEIPKGPTGKLLRYVGTERYTASECYGPQVPGLTSDTVSSEVSAHQEKLLQIWKEVLNIPCVSPDDDFFRCGGNSLAAIELLIKIQRAFNLTIPADTIYVYPTVRLQAVMIAKKTGTAKQYDPLVIPIREGGTLPPLFCFHSIGGWIGTYQNIFRFFNQDRPVFGIRARGLEPGEKPSRTIEEAVKDYADAIKTVQKTGPYHLLGYSAGALYAFELACQLQSRGESVIYLGNIDQSVPQQRLASTVNYLFFRRNGADTLMATGRHVYRLFHDRLKIRRDGILHTFFMKGMRAFSHRVAYLSGFSPYHDWISAYPKKQQPLIRTLRRALQNYQPRSFSGNLTLFSTRPDLKSYPGDPTRGWGVFIEGKTKIIEIPGDHDNLYLDPYAHVVAQKIEESLKQADVYE